MDNDFEAEESSDDTMASTRKWYRIDPDSIPARPPRFEFKGSPGVTITKRGDRASHLDYRLKLIVAIITKYFRKSGTKKKGQPGCPLNMKRIAERHFPSHIPATVKKQKPTRRCVACCMKRGENGKNIRKEIRIWCRWCEKALCAVPCFERHHINT
ncbi:hypothetical protein HPB49_012578 [Dermacentor silvarum]|uniref:Uncharacterized protein n=1 Tax=Dermacentor silvarum TaxID=543639 RepID=A0ACB8DP62_DERSI|nr:hypothetical protein HPB49_012578 [Dermacentor silvarum]